MIFRKPIQIIFQKLLITEKKNEMNVFCRIQNFFVKITYLKLQEDTLFNKHTEKKTPRNFQE